MTKPAKQPLVVKGAGNEFSVHAEYVAEMVRQMMYAQYREEAYTRGLNVVTTIDSADQDAAYHALRKGLMDYEHRHGYRGPEAYIDLPADADDREQAIDDALRRPSGQRRDRRGGGDRGEPEAGAGELHRRQRRDVQGNGLRFAPIALGTRAQPNQRIRPGAIIRLVKDDDGNWSITQLPQVEGAFVSVVPQDGAIRALVGGFDFNKNKFNHVTQAWRQPGSSFKPFIYSASLEKGLSPATIINDAPLFFSAAETGGQAWEPKNYGGGFDGPMTDAHRADEVEEPGFDPHPEQDRPQVRAAIHHAFRFRCRRAPGLSADGARRGSGHAIADGGAYSVFANGGYRVNPYLIAESPIRAAPSSSHAAAAGRRRKRAARHRRRATRT